MNSFHVQAFDSESSLAEYSRGAGHDISPEALAFFDLDRVGEWLADPRPDTLDAVLLLNTWNLIEDYLRSTCNNDVEQSLGAVELYDKLFWANNLLAVTPPGERFDPSWTIEEMTELAGILTEPYKRLCEAFDTEVANTGQPQGPPSADQPGG